MQITFAHNQLIWSFWPAGCHLMSGRASGWQPPAGRKNSFQPPPLLKSCNKKRTYRSSTDIQRRSRNNRFDQTQKKLRWTVFLELAETEIVDHSGTWLLASGWMQSLLAALFWTKDRWLSVHGSVHVALNFKVWGLILVCSAKMTKLGDQLIIFQNSYRPWLWPSCV